MEVCKYLFNDDHAESQQRTAVQKPKYLRMLLFKEKESVGIEGKGKGKGSIDDQSIKIHEAGVS